MVAADERFRRLVEEAHRDPAILGLVLTGSRGKGFGAASSDYDVLLIVREADLEPYRARYAAGRSPGIDWSVQSLAEFGEYAAWGSQFAWDRYSFAHAAVLVDKTGHIRAMVDAKGSIPDHECVPVVRTALDAYVNAVYRSLKCWRNGNHLGARLEAADSIGYALTVIFALEGRHRPYFGYLEREVRAHPLRAFPLDADELLATVWAIVADGDPAPQQRLLGSVEAVCREAGHGDVIDDWGADYGWIKRFRAPGTG